MSPQSRPVPQGGPPRLRLIFTLDYEIHGNGEGSPRELLVSTTDRLLTTLEDFGAKLTIMADTVEILKFREYRDQSGRDDFCYEAIEEQLKRTIARGHDVQLHLHTAYGRAHFSGGRWVLDYSEYDLTGLGYGRICDFVRQGKEYLEGLLTPVNPSYRCHAFRAANWSMSPSVDVVKALVANGIRIDTSVFKYGFRDGLVHFDYAAADSDTIPWPLDSSDVCRRDDRSNVFEFPIYCESRPIWSFLSVNRVNRVVLDRLHALPASAPEPDEVGGGKERAAGAGAGALFRKGAGAITKLFQKHALKLDFNQCSGRQMVAALDRADARYAGRQTDLPIVLIGHSKLMNAFNEGQIRTFLKYVSSRPDRFGFATFGDFELERFRRPGAA
jgi:hypothetical protein